MIFSSSSWRHFRCIVALLAVFAGAQMAFGQVVEDPVTVPVQYQGSFEASSYGSISISPYSGNSAAGSGSGSGVLTTNGVAQLRPGRAYIFSITHSTNSVTRLRAKITAPSGYRVFINNVEHEMFDWAMGGGGPLLSAGSFTVRIDTGTGAPVAAATSLRPGRVLWSVGLGNLRNGKPAGNISLAESGLTAATFTPAALFYDRDQGTLNGLSVGDDGEVIVIKASNALRQVYATTVLVDIVTESSSVYYLRFYPRDTSQIGTYDTNTQLYPVSGTPLFEFKIENPTPATLDRLRITKTVNQNGTLTTWTEMAKLSGGGNTWVVQDWTEKPSGAVSVSSEVVHRWTYTNNDLNEDFRVENSSGALIHHIARVYADLNYGTDISRELIQETVGDALTAETTTYTYELSSTNLGAWRRPKLITTTSGSWTAFEYNSGFADRGSLSQIRKPHKNSPSSDPGSASVSGEITNFTYSYTDNWGTNILPTQITNIIDGVQVGRKDLTYTEEWVTDAAATYQNSSNAVMPVRVITLRDYTGASAYLEYVSKSYREDADPEFRFLTGLPRSVKRPDKTMTMMAYFRADFIGFGSIYNPSLTGGARVHISMNGTSDLSAGSSYTSYPGGQPLEPDFRLVEGKSMASTAFFGEAGAQLINEQKIWLSGGWQTIQQDWTQFQNYIWPIYTQRKGGNADGFKTLASIVLSGGRPSSQTSLTGVVQTFGYDAIGRVQSVVRSGAVSGANTVAALTMTNTYDAAGRVLTQTITGGSESLVSSRAYDTAGRVTSELSPGVSATNYTYDILNRTVTVTLPNTATRVETRLLDGRLSSITGTAVVPEYFDYTVASDGTRYTLNTIGSQTDVRRREAWTDWLGRTTITRVPGFTGQPTSDEGFSYDSTTGRLAYRLRTGSTWVRYEYNAMSEVVRSGLDIDGSGLQPASNNDRITDFDTSVESYNGSYWLTSYSWAYPKSGDATRRLAGYTRKRLTGLSSTVLEEIHQWDSDNDESIRLVTLDAANKLVTTATSSPGLLNAATETKLNDLPISSTGFDGLSVAREYDNLLRPWRETFPRTAATGKTVTTYWPNTANPKEVKDATDTRVISYSEYDVLGRATATLDAKGKDARVQFNLRGQPIYQWGAANNPVQFEYDNYGQRTRMFTYRADPGSPGSSWSQGDATGWKYHAATGLLESKTDPAGLPDATGAATVGGHTVSYTYNMRGQTEVRTWARGVTSTYAYDGSTSELTGITYSDGTPAVGYTYTRLGQVKTVSDFTTTTAAGGGARSVEYAAGNPWRLDYETLPAFYGSRRLTRTYDAATSSNTGVTSYGNAYTSHTLGSATGRYRGYQLGTSSASAADLETTYAISNLGRFAGLDSKWSNGGSVSQFTYGYETNSPLLKFTGVIGNSFNVVRAYEPGRDLLTDVDSKWGAGSVAKFTYAYDERRQRQSVVQSGDIYTNGADYGDAIHQIYNYDTRGQITSAGTYAGASATSTVNQLSARRHAYAYDAIGNRQWSGTSASGTLNDNYTVNSQNQYVTRENNTLPVGGTVDASAKVAVSVTATALAGRAGRHWGDNIIVANGSQPFAGSIPVYSAKLGGAPGGGDLFRVESRLAYLAKALQSFSYDADGNMTSDGVWDYRWDAENRLVGADISSLAQSVGYPAKHLAFAYDAQNRRVQKTLQVLSGSTWTTDTIRRYLYDGNNLIAEFDQSATLRRSFTWGLDMSGSLGATGGIGALLQINDNVQGKALFPAYDGNGNVTALVNATTGATEAAYEYGPFGELLRASGAYAADNPFRFSTKFTDDETGLINYGVRHYSPGLGRFINRDPIAEQGGLNLYGFCNNDAVNGVDYLGYSWLSKLWKNSVGWVGKKIAQNWNHARPYIAAAVAIVVTVVVAIYAPQLLGVTSNFWGAVVGGAAGGFAGGATGVALNGGSFNQALSAGIQGAVVGGVLGGLGYYANQITLPSNQFAASSVNVNIYRDMSRVIAAQSANSTLSTISAAGGGVLGTGLSVGEFLSAAGSGAAQGVYNVTVGAVTSAYSSGVNNMAASWMSFSEGDWKMGSLHGLAMAGDVAGLALTAAGAGQAIAAGGRLFGAYAARGLAAETTAARTLTTAEESLFSRVSRPKGFKEQVWEINKGNDGLVRDPTGKVLKFDEPWELGHVPGNKFSDAQIRAAQQGWDRATWIKYQNDPYIYRPELPRTNAGHLWETTY